MLYAGILTVVAAIVENSKDPLSGDATTKQSSIVQLVGQKPDVYSAGLKPCYRKSIIHRVLGCFECDQILDFLLMVIFSQVLGLMCN